jgi:hypothetical protein
MMRITLTVLLLAAISGCQILRASDSLCPPLRAFVASVEPNVTREIVFDTSWGGGFKGDKDAMYAKGCVHDSYVPAKVVCDSLMQTGAAEFAGYNATRAVSCLSPHTQFAKRIQLEQGTFKFNYGTDNRGANVTVSFVEDEALGAMALHVKADGY